MNKVKEKSQGVKAFFSSTIAEMKKCAWPERQELVESTVVVIVSVIMLCVFVGVSDWLLVKFLELLVPPTG